MIGPVDSYQSLYVAMCGRVFSNAPLGKDHERNCAACKDQDDQAVCDECGFRFHVVFASDGEEYSESLFVVNFCPRCGSDID